MSLIRVRKKAVFVEEIFHEGGPPVATPPKRGFICAAIHNPYAGRFEPDIMPLMADMKPLGLDMAEMLIAALGGGPEAIQGFGKGAVVGEAGEVEHGALWHEPGGYGMRDALGGAKAIVPSSKKVGGPGTRIDIPITYIQASYVRSHFDAIEASLTDAPRANEILVILAMTTGGRVHARSGGLALEDVKGEDGLR